MKRLAWGLAVVGTVGILVAAQSVRAGTDQPAQQPPAEIREHRADINSLTVPSQVREFGSGVEQDEAEVQLARHRRFRGRYRTSYYGRYGGYGGYYGYRPWRAPPRYYYRSYGPSSYRPSYYDSHYYYPPRGYIGGEVGIGGVHVFW